MRQIHAGRQALNDLAQTTLPGALSLRIALALRALRDPMAAHEEAMCALARKHGAPVEGKPGFYHFAPDGELAFQAEADELGLVDVELALEKIPAAGFEKVEGVKPGTLAALDWLIQL